MGGVELRISKAPRVVLLGQPGAGKSTQALRLAGRLQVPVIGRGDAFRRAIATGDPRVAHAKSSIERDSLVPDDLVLTFMLQRLAEHDCRAGFAIHGFPYNRAQAEALASWLVSRGERLGAVIFIDLPDQERASRLRGYRYCPYDGAGYHVNERPPRVSDRCDECGRSLVTRESDNAVTRGITASNASEFAGVLAFYREQDLIVEIDGAGSEVEVGRRIEARFFS